MFRKNESNPSTHRRFYSVAEPQLQPPELSTEIVPEIRFVRSDTHTQEEITPPIYAGDDDHHKHKHNRNSSGSSFNLPTTTTTTTTTTSSSSSSPTSRKRLSFFNRSSRSQSVSSSGAPPSPPRRVRGERRLSQLLHLDRGSGSRHSRNSGSSSTSVNIPSDLPQIGSDGGDKQEREAQWEKRATVLVQQNPRFSVPQSELRVDAARPQSRSSSRGSVNDPEGDVNIQEAIRLHEAGDLEKSTQMFAQLADPNGANNALSQVLYGLALRHGWGCSQDPEKAVIYLSAAASNSALVESEALRAGMKKGGAAKGELVLAIFELANCFRNGWGIRKDPIAARQYYETAANLGDTDAMNEIAWCYLEGFGGKKDKYMAAKYYRLAEENGNKTWGNSWIWKEKYNPK